MEEVWKEIQSRYSNILVQLMSNWVNERKRCLLFRGSKEGIECFLLSCGYKTSCKSTNWLHSIHAPLYLKAFHVKTKKHVQHWCNLNSFPCIICFWNYENNMCYLQKKKGWKQSTVCKKFTWYSLFTLSWCHVLYWHLIDICVFLCINYYLYIT